MGCQEELFPVQRSCTVALCLGTLNRKTGNCSSVQGKGIRLRTHTCLKNTHWHKKRERAVQPGPVGLVDTRVNWRQERVVYSEVSGTADSLNSEIIY